jgi:hypothetical protein
VEAERLAMDEKYEITPEDLLRTYAVTDADIAIVVKYQPWFIPIKRQRQFRFFTKHFQDGETLWFERPVDE